jgi:hypothetical protein
MVDLIRERCFRVSGVVLVMLYVGLDRLVVVFVVNG